MFWGVERTVTVVESPVLVGKLTSGCLMLISFGRITFGSSVFVFSCSSDICFATEGTA